MSSYHAENTASQEIPSWADTHIHACVSVIITLSQWNPRVSLFNTQSSFSPGTSDTPPPPHHPSPHTQDNTGACIVPDCEWNQFSDHVLSLSTRATHREWPIWIVPASAVCRSGSASCFHLYDSVYKFHGRNSGGFVRRTIVSAVMTAGCQALQGISGVSYPV